MKIANGILNSQVQIKDHPHTLLQSYKGMRGTIIAIDTCKNANKDPIFIFLIKISGCYLTVHEEDIICPITAAEGFVDGQIEYDNNPERRD